MFSHLHPSLKFSGDVETSGNRSVADTYYRVVVKLLNHTAKLQK